MLSVRTTGRNTFREMFQFSINSLVSVLALPLHSYSNSSLAVQSLKEPEMHRMPWKVRETQSHDDQTCRE